MKKVNELRRSDALRACERARRLVADMIDAGMILPDNFEILTEATRDASDAVQAATLALSDEVTR